MRGNILATENQHVIEVDTGGPVWKLGSELAADEFLPTPEELEDLKKPTASGIRQIAGERKMFNEKDIIANGCRHV